MQAVHSARAETGQGLIGDAAYGSRNRQVLLIDSETLQEFGLSPGDVRENLTSSGLQPAQLEAGVELQAGEALLQVIGDCAPCSMMDELRPGLQAAIEGRRGVLARVLQGGAIRVGDSIHLRRAAASTKAAEAKRRVK